jgi:hypothetical protein
MIQFDEARRNDPATRELVKAAELRKAEALREAEKALVKARTAITNAVSYEAMKEDAFYMRANRAVLNALGEVRTTLSHSEVTETYIGNLAASRVGALLQVEAAQREQA